MTDIINADTITGFPAAKTFNVSWHGETPVVCITDYEGRITRYELVREHIVIAFKGSTDHVLR